MCSSQTLLEGLRAALSRLWGDVQDQFTVRVSKYRGLKSRPPWNVLEATYFETLADISGFGLNSSAGATKATQAKAASLADFCEEVIALEFAIDVVEDALNSAQEYMMASTRRRLKGGGVAKALGKKDTSKEVDSFSSAWVEDGEFRALCNVATRVIAAADGPSGHLQAGTMVMHILLGAFTGMQPLFRDRASKMTLQISDAHAQAGKIPPPMVDDPEEATASYKFDIIANSYMDVAQEFKILLQATPQATLALIRKVQAHWKGYRMRVKTMQRTKIVAKYCLVGAWPPAPSAEEKREKLGQKSLVRVARPLTLEEKIDSAQPQVSKFLGGQQATAKSAAPAGTTAQAAATTAPAGETADGQPAAAADGESEPDAPPPEIRLTADHRACADFFALYMYTMFMRNEMRGMWKVVTWGYDHMSDGFEELLSRNKNLQPMVESVGAQLKRGALVGFDKAFGKKTDLPLNKPPGTIKPPATMQAGGATSADMFKRPAMETAPAMGTARSSPQLPAANLPEPVGRLPESGRSATSGTEQAYMKAYLVEMDGDDSQFRDIEANVAPLSSGSSPPRSRPEDVLFEAKWTKGEKYDHLGQSVDTMLRTRGSFGSTSQQSQPQSAASTPKERTKPDVPWCLDRLKCMWLAIKAHRFTAHRSKVLQLLPNPVLQQYVEHEKAARYGACIKLLATATPGNLNVLEPGNLPNKPLLIETVFQLLVGYLGLCLKNQHIQTAVSLLLQMIDALPVALRDLHPTHKTVMEAYLYDTALSVAYYVPADTNLANKAENFFKQASTCYRKLGHRVRFSKCCCRYASFLAVRQQYHEGEFYLQQAVTELADLPTNSLSVVLHHNQAVLCALQNRMPDALVHMRTYTAQLKQLARLSSAWLQHMDNTQWLLLKLQDLWPQQQHQHVKREPSANVGR
jgi:hypothetical protein